MVLRGESGQVAADPRIRRLVVDDDGAHPPGLELRNQGCEAEFEIGQSLVDGDDRADGRGRARRRCGLDRFRGGLARERDGFRGDHRLEADRPGSTGAVDLDQMGADAASHHHAGIRPRRSEEMGAGQFPLRPDLDLDVALEPAEKQARAIRSRDQRATRQDLHMFEDEAGDLPPERHLHVVAGMRPALRLGQAAPDDPKRRRRIEHRGIDVPAADAAGAERVDVVFRLAAPVPELERRPAGPDAEPMRLSVEGLDRQGQGEPVPAALTGSHGLELGAVAVQGPWVADDSVDDQLDAGLRGLEEGREPALQAIVPAPHRCSRCSGRARPRTCDYMCDRAPSR